MSIKKTLDALDAHYDAFRRASYFARETRQPTPNDTAAWSQIIVGTLTGKSGLDRRKGPDFVDGSDVKAANIWESIDRPRFNGCIPKNFHKLQDIPHLFFVLWDYKDNKERCRIWAVRPSDDICFFDMCHKWYFARAHGIIKSENFQLHPPINEDENVFRSQFAYLEYPLVMSAIREKSGYKLEYINMDAIKLGRCV